MALQSRHIEALNGPLNVLDLRHFTAADLRPLLEAEAREWNAQLMWDYTASSEMILRYADSRILPGYAVLENGTVSAYAFFVYEGNKAVIGDIYASENSITSREDLQDRLLLHVIETLEQTPGITRIEAQLLLHPSGALAPAFENEGFSRYRRLFMRRKIDGNHSLRVPVPKGLKVRRWQEMDFQPASTLITKSYLGHVDSVINDQYRTASGSLRFLNNIVRFPGCGTFDPTASFVVIDESRNLMIGLLLCSRVRREVAHITQVCLLPEYRGRGLGRMLIGMCSEELHNRKLTTLTLTVTERNDSAVTLYEQLGFTKDRLFDAFVWER